MNSHPAQNAGKVKAASLALWRQTERPPPEPPYVTRGNRCGRCGERPRIGKAGGETPSHSSLKHRKERPADKADPVCLYGGAEWTTGIHHGWRRFPGPSTA